MDMATDLHCHPHHPHFLCSMFIGPSPSSPSPLSLEVLKYRVIHPFYTKDQITIQAKTVTWIDLDSIEVYCNENYVDTHSFVKTNYLPGKNKT